MLEAILFIFMIVIIIGFNNRISALERKITLLSKGVEVPAAEAAKNHPDEISEGVPKTSETFHDKTGSVHFWVGKIVKKEYV